MEKVFVCTCWDVDGGVCEVHRLRDMTDCDYDWDNLYEECDEVSERDIDFVLSDIDDEIPF